MTISQMYRETCLKALNKAPTVKQAALILGVDERTVYNWMNMYHIEYDTRNNIYYIKQQQ